MAVQGEIEVKQLTKHSALKTLLKKLKAGKEPRSSIIGVIGVTYKRTLFSRLRGRR